MYFPETAVVSFVSRLESGRMLGVGLVGRDGIPGSSNRWSPRGVAPIDIQEARNEPIDLSRETSEDKRHRIAGAET